MADVWGMIHEERLALHQGLSELPEEDWTKPSLCTGWLVRDVVLHIISTMRMTAGQFFDDFINAGFRFNKMVEKNVQRNQVTAVPGFLLGNLANYRLLRNKPPGPVGAMLGESIVHSEDIFRALGPYHEHPEAHKVACANFFSKNKLLVPGKKRIAGLTLTATDAQWKMGDGPEVQGPLIALIMAMAGRRVALEDLSGEGLQHLGSQL